MGRIMGLIVGLMASLLLQRPSGGSSLRSACLMRTATGG
jgi:hypothetical protein